MELKGNYNRGSFAKSIGLHAGAVVVMAFLGLSLATAAAGQGKPKLDKHYKEWLEHDVVYIISKDERDAFKKLSSDDARDKFIKEFWDIRNPDPGSAINSYEEEHYQRLAFAESRYGVGSGREGWRTDRGRTYITLGPPQQKQTYRNAANLRPIEVWFYANSNPALPAAFYVMFFDRDNTNDYVYYSPYLDGPDKLTTGVEAINSPAEGLHMIMDSVGAELARQSLSLIVGEPVDLTDPRPSLASDTMIMMIKALNDLPSYRDDIRRKRMNLEQVSSSMILTGHNLDVILLPVRDERGITRLDYSLRLKTPSDLSLLNTKDDRISYSVQVRVQVFDTASNKLIFTYQKELKDILDKGRYHEFKEKVFSYEGMLPLPPGQYRLAFQFTDWTKNASYRAERDVTIPKVDSSKFEVPGLLPFSAAEQVDPVAAPVLPFTLAGVQFTPMSTSNLVVATDQSVQVAYQIWTAPTNPALKQDKNIEIEYGIGEPSVPGSAKTIKDLASPQQFDAAGSLVSGKKLSPGSSYGNYILTLAVGGTSSDSRSFAKLNLKVVDPGGLPPAPWIVVETSIREDMEKGAFDRDRGLCFLSQNQAAEARLWLRRALAANHDDEVARGRLVDAYYAQQDFAAVAALYKDTGVTDEADANTLLKIATSLRKLGREKDGLSLMEHGAAARSSDPAMYLALGDYYTLLGNTEKATAAIQKSRKLTVPN
jgi:GWxTD domain-containing protein